MPEDIDKKKTVRALYNESVDIYDRRYHEIQGYKYQIILEHTEISDEQTILDVGSGTGLFFQFLQENSCNKYGIDFSFKSLKRCQVKFNNNRDIQLICGDAEALPLRNGIFDTVLVITLFQNLPNPIKCLHQVKALCKKNGKIVLSFLKKKFSIERIQHVLKDIRLKSAQIINDKNCEDIIVIINNH